MTTNSNTDAGSKDTGKMDSGNKASIEHEATTLSPTAMSPTKMASTPMASTPMASTPIAPTPMASITMKTPTAMARSESLSALHEYNEITEVPGTYPPAHSSHTLPTPILSNSSRKSIPKDDSEGKPKLVPYNDEDNEFGHFLNVSNSPDRHQLIQQRFNAGRPPQKLQFIKDEKQSSNNDWNNADTLPRNNVQKGPVSTVPLANLFQTPPLGPTVGPVLSTPDLFNLQKEQEQNGLSTLSIPKLSTGTHSGHDIIDNMDDYIEKRRKQRPSVSFRSSISSSGSDFDDDDDTLDDGTPPDMPRPRNLMSLDSNRRVSLTVDMETGRSPGRNSQFHRGQSVLKRSCSVDMMTAQSPRVRRMRQLSQNMESFRIEAKKIKKLLALPPGKLTGEAQKKEAGAAVKGDSDSDDEFYDIEGEAAARLKQHRKRKVNQASVASQAESLKETDRNRRNRYTVQQKSVRYFDRKRLLQKRDVQYRLSAISQTELRRRRYRQSIDSRFNIPSNLIDSIHDPNHQASENSPKTRLGKAVARFRKWLRMARIFVGEFLITTISRRNASKSTGLIVRLLHFTFRRNIFFVFLLAALSFYVATVFFAVFVYLIGVENPQCIHVNGVDFGETRTQFIDAFALSWTTFTTVGYGLVYPATSATLPSGFNVAKECTGMVILTTMEAFCGILFSALWGAIVFAKVTRVGSFAQVSFSDAIIIKYGTGVTGVVEDDDEYGSSSDDDDPDLFNRLALYKASKLPCPILEFRIANRLHNRRGGEIIDACINIVASMEESQASIQNGSGMGANKRRRHKRGRGKQNAQRRKKKKFVVKDDGTVEEEDAITDEVVERAREAAEEMVSSYIETSARDDKGSSVERGGDSNMPFPNQVFAKLMVETMEHPFFNRVWNVRHVLDESSPILKAEAKELIRVNKGHWPEELNSAIGVRSSIHFSQILVSFSGTSNVDANSVYSQKAYNFMDVGVGYAFCNMLFRESDGSIGVDHKLLNDVKEQSGGGGEPLDLWDSGGNPQRALKDIFIL